MTGASGKDFNQEAERLAGLPRAERFEQLLDFPTTHTFKAIGRREGWTEAVRAVLDEHGFGEATVTERQSAGQRFASLTFDLEVSDGEQLDRIYTALEQLPGLAFML